MINIRPVSDLRNKFSEIENIVLQDQEPIYLTKNGYGTMVLMSIEQYSDLTNEITQKLEEADLLASLSPIRYTGEEVFARARKRIYE